MMRTEEAVPAAGARTPLLVNWEARAGEQRRRGVPYEQVVDLQAQRVVAQAGGRASVLLRELRTQHAAEDQRVEDTASIVIRVRRPTAPRGHA